VDLMQIILIEPDAHRLGWGVAKFSGQFIEFFS
jgi:hypothetical protein